MKVGRATSPNVATADTRAARVELVIAPLVAVAMLALAIGGGLDLAGVLGPADRWVGDTLTRQRNPPRVPAEIVAVALDGPASRTQFARAINALHRAEARVISIDVAFERRGDPREDDALLRALRRAKPVVLGALVGEVDAAGYTRPRLFRSGPALDAAGVRVGFSAYPVEPDGKVRRVAVVPLDLDESKRPRLPSAVDPHAIAAFPFVVALEAGGGVVAEGVPTNNAVVIDFRGPPGTFRTIPFIDVARGRAPPEVFRDKIVVIAATRRFGAATAKPVPTGDAMDFVEIDANAIATLLYGSALHQPKPWTHLLVLLAAAFLPLAAFRAGPWTWAKRWLLVPTTAIAIVAGAWPRFDGLILWPWTYAALVLTMSTLGTWLVLRRAP